MRITPFSGLTSRTRPSTRGLLGPDKPSLPASPRGRNQSLPHCKPCPEPQSQLLPIFVVWKLRLNRGLSAASACPRTGSMGGFPRAQNMGPVGRELPRTPGGRYYFIPFLGSPHPHHQKGHLDLSFSEGSVIRHFLANTERELSRNKTNGTFHFHEKSTRGSLVRGAKASLPQH